MTNEEIWKKHCPDIPFDGDIKLALQEIRKDDRTLQSRPTEKEIEFMADEYMSKLLIRDKSDWSYGDVVEAFRYATKLFSSPSDSEEVERLKIQISELEIAIMHNRKDYQELQEKFDRKKLKDAIQCAGLQIELLESLRDGNPQLNTSIETKELLKEALSLLSV